MAAHLTELLEAQLDLLDEQVEGWKHEHGLAMICRDVEDLIALALETLERIRKRCDVFNAGGDAQASEGEALLNYWRRWHRIALRALEEVVWIESRGYHPEKSDVFRFAINEASIAAQWDKVNDARRRVALGHVKGLQEIDDELSHHAG